jgi:large subunit ribosomal protein L6
MVKKKIFKGIYFKVLFVPKNIKIVTIKNCFNYNYIIFFSKMGFLKYKFNRNYINVSSKFNKIKLSGPNYILFKSYQKTVNNLIESVVYAYKINLNLFGLGFKYRVLKSCIFFILGYSHLVNINIPKNISINFSKKKLVLSSHDRLLLNKFFNNLKALRPIDVYKGKGFHITGQTVKVKKGKQTSF